MRPALLKVYSLEQVGWGPHFQNHWPKRMPRAWRVRIWTHPLWKSPQSTGRKCYKVSTDAGSVLLKEEIQAERWYCVTLWCPTGAGREGLRSQEDIRKLWPETEAKGQRLNQEIGQIEHKAGWNILAWCKLRHGRKWLKKSQDTGGVLCWDRIIGRKAHVRLREEGQRPKPWG